MTGTPLHFDEALVRSLIDSAAEPLILLDEGGGIVFLNAPAAALFDHPSGELRGRPIEVLIPPSSAAALIAHQAALSGVPPNQTVGSRLALVGRRRNGVEFPLEVSLSPVKTSQGGFIVLALLDTSGRHKIVQALQEAEHHLHQAFQAVPTAMVVAGLDGRVLRANNALCQLIGYAPEELTQMTIASISHPEDLVADLELAGQLVRGEIPSYQLVKRLFCKDGTVGKFLLSVSVVRDSSGAVLYYVGQLEVISDPPRGDRARQLADARLHELIDKAPEAILIANQQGCLTAVNSAACQLLGYPREALLGLTNWQAILAAGGQLPAAVREHLLGPGQSQTHEWMLRRKDGTLVATEVSIKDLSDGGWVTFIRDITERKRSADKLRDSLQWLRAMLAQSPVGMILIYGPQAERVEVNTHAERLIGSLVSRIGQEAEPFLTADEQPIPHKELPSVRALAGENLPWREYALRRAEGPPLPILASAAPVLDSKGRVQGAVIAFQDVSPVKELERLRAEWNSIIAHDMRQPLTAITLTAQSMARELRDVAKFRSPLDRIVKSAKRLTCMIADLLDLSQLEAQQLTLLRKPIDLPGLVRASVDAIAIEAADRPFDIQIRGPIPQVLADGDRVAQILDNLLTNAVKYGQATTPIVIEIAPAAQGVTVAVTNQGAGIAPSDLPLLFQRFRRTEAARSSGVQGIGLGLYIAAQLIAAHGGNITAESTPGRLTTFRFVLPLGPPA